MRAHLPHAIGAVTIGPAVAAAMVVANMVGTGVFTCLGLQLAAIPAPLAVMLLWALGGLAALCGALTYGELGASMPRSGGEYQYLARAYHPCLGFLSGWVSVTVGFPAPAALSAMAFGAYFSAAVPVASAESFAVAAVVVLTLVQCLGVRAGTAFQCVCSAMTVILIVAFCLCGLVLCRHPVPVDLAFSRGLLRDIASPAFAVSLVYVFYAYSGWNAAAYIAGDIARPQKNLPLALWAGTGLVVLLYLLLNYTFLATATVGQLAGQIEVASISAVNIFGPRGRDIASLLIATLLVSSVSSFIFVGPRITQAMGEDHRLLHAFARRTSRGVPLTATLLQSAISLLLIATASFEPVLLYAGFSLNLCTFLAVAGVFVCRKRYPAMPRPYRTWGYPVVPFVFLTIMGWNLIYLLVERPLACAAGLAVMLAGLAVYRFSGMRPSSVC